MNIIIKTKDIKLSPAVEGYIKKRVEGLKKFIKNFDGESIRTEVEVGKTSRRHQSGDIFRSEINLTVGGKFFRAESEQATVQAAVDETRDDLEQQIRKFKNKQDTIFIRGARSLKKRFGLSPLARFRKKP
ncbi:MAG: hypothetical protein UV36_C0015G0009 [Parcubacteria group bacterium GW2011_GWC2_42_6]|nr:MAG: hypothetical protein UU87_C0002G0068 [Parcubacteria group bacterium GW2011_GWA2_42_11]KKS66907.1 MAG: hypothetical protein UV36_C0015G0009 [Parcubacteria group bacterium GW2011_GWC2_42_6]